MSAPAIANRQYCTFRLAQFHCGIEVLTVREILRHQPLTRVPLAPPVVQGLLNLRGQIITALDLRLRLAFPPRGPDQPPTILVVGRGDDDAVALLVDEIGDVLDIDPATCEPPPDTIQGELRDLIQGVCKREQGLVLLLDAQRAAQAA
jgi:purine-binding chemotaxis protein CheW